MQKTFYKSKVRNEKISKNFMYKEFACKDGSDMFLLDTDMIPVIQKFRDFVEVAVPIDSAYRTKYWNKKVGGTDKSYHLEGKAFDIPFRNTYQNIDHSIYKMGDFFNTLKVKGIIRYSWGYHIDLRKNEYHATSSGKYVHYGKLDNIKFETIRKNSRNIDVGCLQFMLVQLGYNLAIDCIFGEKTKNAVLHFQETRNLKLIDGIVGRETWGALLK